jgi:hypothetical protein
LPLGCFASDRGKIHLDGSASLAEFVVYFSRHQRPFLFTHELEARR